MLGGGWVKVKGKRGRDKKHEEVIQDIYAFRQPKSH
jgi:hypothetical protein